MKASELSPYVTPGIDINEGDVVTIASAGTVQKFDDGNQRLQLVLELPSGKSKFFSLNDTSRKALILKYGDETEDWVDKKAKVTIVSQNVKGAMKKVVYLSAV